MSRPALLIIDVQANVFSRQAFRILEVAERLSGLASAARAAGAPVIFIQHDEPDCEWAYGSPGWQFDPRLAPEAGDDVVAKHHCDSFRGTTLAETLARRGVDRLIVGGYATDFCVDTTVRAAASREIDTTVIADGHTTRDKPHLDAAAIVRHHTWIWSQFGAPLGVAASGDVTFR